MNATHVRVFNSNAFTIEDRFDGILYRFTAGDKDGKLVPIIAAALIFGMRVTDDERGLSVDFGMNEDGSVALDSRYIQRRWGWNTIIQKRDEDLAIAVARMQEEADAKVANLRLVPVQMHMREVQAGSVPSTLPPPRETDDDEGKARAKVAKMRAE